MLTIHKYPLRRASWSYLELPAGAHVLHAAFQREDICLWALVDTNNKPATRTFYVAATGDRVPDRPTSHISTVLTPNGEFVYHVFEVFGE